MLPQFRFIEAVVIVLCTLIVATLLGTWGSQRRSQAQVANVLQRGHSIYLAINGFYHTPEESLGQQLPSLERFRLFHNPRYESFRSATDYFRAVVTNGILPDYSYFAAPGVPEYRDSAPEGFSSNNVAWCVTADFDEVAERVPAYFTKNLGIDRLSQNASRALTTSPPFRLRGVVVIFKGGAGTWIPRDEIDDRFNPIGATNRVIIP